MTIVFTGENSFERELAFQKYVSQFVERYGDMAVERYEDAETMSTGEIVSAVSALPFLTDRRMVILRGIAANKLALEDISQIVAAVPDSTELLLVEQALDARTKAYKFLQKNVDFRLFHAISEHALPDWVASHFAELGVRIHSSIATHLIDRVGQNQQLLANEIDKICLYTKEPTVEAIDEIVDYLPHSSVFAMIDSVFAGDIEKSLRLYDEQRAQGMEPFAILGMIVWQLHALSVVKTAGTMSADEIASMSKLSPFVIRKNQTIVRKLTLKKIKSMVADTLQVDLQLKRTSTAADEALKTLILSFA